MNVLMGGLRQTYSTEMSNQLRVTALFLHAPACDNDEQTRACSWQMCSILQMGSHLPQRT
jgi:hypothetical protein